MLPSITSSHLDSILHRLSSRSTKKQSIQPLGHRRSQNLSQFQHFVMQPNIHLSMHNTIALRLGCGHDARVTVSRVEYANAGGEIEEVEAAGGADPGAPAFGEGEVG